MMFQRSSTSSPAWEWTPILDPHSAYGGGVVGISGTVVKAELSDNDVPLYHPWGNDHEYYISPDRFDDGSDPFRPLLGASNYDTTHGGEYSEANLRAQDMGLPIGVLGVETDRGLIPEAYRPKDPIRDHLATPDHVAVFGRWIVDTGHNDFHTEIHPPLLVAKAHPDPDRADWTTSTVIGNPYLVGQDFLVGDDQRPGFLNRGDDDGGIAEHGIHEMLKTLGIGCPWYYLGHPCSTRLEAHPGILAKPFEGTQTLDYILRPPTPRQSLGDRLALSYHLITRPGIAVEFRQDAGPDAVHVRVTMNAAAYSQAPLPPRHEATYYDSHLFYVALADVLVGLHAPWTIPYALAVTARGILTDTYDAPTAPDLPHYWQNSVDVDGSNNQRFPIYGYIDVGWQRATATHLGITAPPQVVAGAALPVTLGALDADNNPVGSYRGTVHFRSTDPLATLPADYTFTAADGGRHSWPTGFVLRTARPQTITATETVGGTISGSLTLLVVPDVANTLATSGVPASLPTNQPITVTVTAKDRFGNTATGYRGTVHFTSTDGSASLPANYTFSADDQGSHAFEDGVLLRTTGPRLLAVTDTAEGTITSPPAAVSVTPEVASLLSITVRTAFPLAGQVLTITVTAKDRSGNTATGYRGTVRFTSPDGAATLPDMYTFTAADGGEHTWTGGVVLRTAGSQTVSVTDTVNRLLTATYRPIVYPGDADYFLFLDVPPVLTAGTATDLTAVVMDRYGNAASGYRGTIHFTSSDPSARLPADYTFHDYDAGSHSWHNGLTVFTAGQPNLTAVDRTTPAVNRQVSLTVAPADARTLVVNAPAGASAGTPFDVTVSALDPYGNLASGYVGTVTFASSDGAALLPDDYTFTPDDGGVHTFAAGVTLFAAGDQTVTVTDTDNALLGNATVTVDSGAEPTGHGRPSRRAIGGSAGSDNFRAVLATLAWSDRQRIPAEPPARGALKPNATALDRFFAAPQANAARLAIAALLRHRAANAGEGWRCQEVWPLLGPEPSTDDP
jgi:hypothetical protein